MSVATAAEILSTLRRCSVDIQMAGDRLHVRAPKEMATPEIKEALAAAKAELLPLLSRQQEILDLPLSAFEGQGLSLEILVPWFRESIFFVSGPGQVESLVRQGVARGFIWTASELRDLWSVPDLSIEEVATIARIKADLGGEVVGVEADQSFTASPAPTALQACRACETIRFWRSTHGAVICGNCHPPAAPELVAEWIDAGPTTASGEGWADV